MTLDGTHNATSNQPVIERALLPESAQELADAVGLVAVATIIRMRGGTRIWNGLDDDLRSALGEDVASAVEAVIPAVWYVPRATRAIKAAERNAIVGAYHRGVPAAELAVAYGYSDRWIYSLVRRRQDEVRSRQRDMF